MANTMKVLSTVTVGAGGAATISFTDIPQTYTDLVIKLSSRAASATNNYKLTVNDGDGTSISLYGGSGIQSSFTATSLTGLTITSGFTANYYSNGEWYIPNYASNTNSKSLQADEVQENNSASSGSTYMYLTSGVVANIAPITKLTLTPNGGISFAQHTTATLYGIFNADVSSAPATPTIGTTSAGVVSASVAFTPVNNAASYTVTSSPGSLVKTGTKSPIVIQGLTKNTAYTFTVKANNPFGSSTNSSASNSVTPNDQVWTSQTMANTANWLGMAYGNGVFATVGYISNICNTSPDGITWTQRTLPSSNNWNDIIYGDKFVAVSGISSSQSATSSDGITWTGRSMPAGTDWGSVAYGNGIYIAVVYNGTTAATSPDGITWTQRTIPQSYIHDIFFGNGIFVAPNYNQGNCFTTTDGITWTSRSLPSVQYWIYGAYANGVYVITDNAGPGHFRAIYSYDTITWTEANYPSTGSKTNAVVYGSNLFLAAPGGVDIFTSPDGINWTKSAAAVTSGTYDASAYGNGKFVMARYNSNVALTTTTT